MSNQRVTKSVIKESLTTAEIYEQFVTNRKTLEAETDGMMAEILGGLEG